MLIDFHYLGIAYYEPAFVEQGVTFQPALWVAIGGFVCAATKKRHEDLGFTKMIRVLAKNGNVWRANQPEPMLRQKWQITAKNVALMSSLSLVTLHVTEDTHRGLKSESKLSLDSRKVDPNSCRLFVGARELRAFTVAEGGIDRRTGHWVDQAEWNGEGGHYADRSGRIEDLKDGWNPDGTPARIKL